MYMLHSPVRPHLENTNSKTKSLILSWYQQTVKTSLYAKKAKPMYRIKKAMLNYYISWFYDLLSLQLLDKLPVFIYLDIFIILVHNHSTKILPCYYNHHLHQDIFLYTEKGNLINVVFLHLRVHNLTQTTKTGIDEISTQTIV